MYLNKYDPIENYNKLEDKQQHEMYLNSIIEIPGKKKRVDKQQHEMYLNEMIVPKETYNKIG